MLSVTSHLNIYILYIVNKIFIYPEVWAENKYSEPGSADKKTVITEIKILELYLTSEQNAKVKIADSEGYNWKSETYIENYIVNWYIT